MKNSELEFEVAIRYIMYYTNIYCLTKCYNTFSSKLFVYTEGTAGRFMRHFPYNGTI